MCQSKAKEKKGEADRHVTRRLAERRSEVSELGCASETEQQRSCNRIVTYAYAYKQQPNKRTNFENQQESTDELRQGEWKQKNQRKSNIDAFIKHINIAKDKTGTHASKL